MARKAVHLANEKEVKQMVLNNPDLQPLWDQIGGLSLRGPPGVQVAPRRGRAFL